MGLTVAHALKLEKITNIQITFAFIIPIKRKGKRKSKDSENDSISEYIFFL